MRESRVASRLGRSKALPPEGPLDVIQRLTDAWIRKDLLGMSRELSDDIIELGPTFAKPLVGKRSFFDKYRTYFYSSLRIELYRILRPHLIRLTPELVLVHFRYRMRTRRGKSVETAKGQESMVLELRRGRWVVRFIHWHKDSLDAHGRRRARKI
jgi:hypothetical protein